MRSIQKPVSLQHPFWPPRKLRGRVMIHDVEFQSLRGNPLGDPFKRQAVLYVPPGYKEGSKKYPAVIALQGFLGTSLTALNTDPFSFNLIQQADSLIEKGLSPFILAIPDGFTRYGGSQYLDSSATGKYETMIVHDFASWLSGNYRVFPEFALLGKSSGGYGALMLGMKHPETFCALASHSGDLYFEWCYKPELPKAAQVLNQYGGIIKFLNAFWKKEKKSPDDITCLNMIAMSSCYSPNPARPHGFDLPFDPVTAELQPQVWKKWINHDPVHLVDKYKNNLKKVKALYLDCGNQDEYFLHFGARIFTRKLKKLGIGFHYEEFPGGHRNIGYRYSVSLPYLIKAMT